MKTLEELTLEVTQWALSKGIFAKANPSTQVMKTVEEANELKAALLEVKDGKKDALLEVKDGIGDVMVTLIILCKMYSVDLSIFLCQPSTLTRPGEHIPLEVRAENLMVAIQTEKGSAYWMKELVLEVQEIAWTHSLHIEDCIQYVLHENDDPLVGRTGKMVDGIFVKDKKI